jgi:flagellar hook-basal body complex protein FliE
MSIESISAVELAPIAAPDALADPAALTAQPPGESFQTVLDGLQRLNAELNAGEKSVTELALGRTDSLHQVMMTAQHTRLDFELALAVRNKILDAYQELMRMPV